MVDYLFHFDVLSMRSSAVELPLYVGIGGKLGWYEHNHHDDHRGHGHDDDDDVPINPQ